MVQSHAMRRHLLPLEVTDRLVMLVGLAIVVGGSIWGLVDTGTGTTRRAGSSRPVVSTAEAAPATRSVEDGASTVAALRARPFRTAILEPGQACPSQQFNLRIQGVGTAIQAGPVAVATFSGEPGLWYRVGESERHRAKALWLVRADQPRPVIVRGKRIDRRGRVEFTNGKRDYATYNLSGDANSTAPPEWRDIPSAVFVPDAGCYAFQVDGPGFESTFILPAGPRTP